VLAVDERAGTVWVDSNRDFVPDRQLYTLRLDGSNASAPRRISNGDGMHATQFGSATNIYADSWSNPQTPPQLSLRPPDGASLPGMGETRPDANQPSWPYRDALIVPEFGTLKAADGATDLYYRLYKPAQFDPARRYPVFMTYYGGPHGQTVARAWGDHFG